MASGDSEFIALMNNDAWMDPHCIEEMVKGLRLKKEYGSCASKILTADGTQLEVCGIEIVADGSSCGRGRLRKTSLYTEIEEVFCANDCCCLYKREMIEDIGDYDPDFFLYCDETDIGFKHQLAGWKCVYMPSALAYHAHSLNAGSYSPFKAFYVERNRILLLFKYFPVWWIAYGTALSVWRYVLWVWMARRRRQGALSKYLEGNSMFAGFAILLRAHLSALRLAPRMFRRRWEISCRRRIDAEAFNDLFKRFGISIRAMAQYE
jgi:GT2 family glycosyltransferase